jgi:hypothetical protein
MVEQRPLSVLELRHIVQENSLLYEIKNMLSPNLSILLSMSSYQGRRSRCVGVAQAVYITRAYVLHSRSSRSVDLMYEKPYRPGKLIALCNSPIMACRFIVRCDRSRFHGAACPGSSCNTDSFRNG